MIDIQKINDLSNKIKELVGSSPLADVEKNLHALLKSAFTKMELVSREEFDVQTEVLRTARLKLEIIEAKLATIESSINGVASNTIDKPSAWI